MTVFLYGDEFKNVLLIEMLGGSRAMSLVLFMAAWHMCDHVGHPCLDNNQLFVMCICHCGPGCKADPWRSPSRSPRVDAQCVHTKN